jgi:aspartyl-tRNA(Asn)/glutamyl-tRNA(Gln) amidotransferase subunit C
MSPHTTVSDSDVKKIASLANLDLSDAEISKFAKQFTDTLQVIDQLQEIDTSDTQATYQVGATTRVTRPDSVDESRVLTQEQTLSQARQTHNGYFVVPRILENK